MKRPILLVCLIAFAITTMAQADYQQWEVMNLKPKPDKLELFKKGLAAHNKKFHAADPYKAGVSSIITGPNSGEYTWFMGPTTWTQMDARPGKGEHDADWDKNVTPYVESAGEVSYWRMDKDLKYRPANVNAAAQTKSRMRFNEILPGQQDRYEEAMKKVIEVFRKKEYKASFSVFWRFGASEGVNVATSLDFDKWAYFDNGINFAKDFDEVHGDNSYNRFMEELDLCIDRRKTYDELSEYLPELSGGN